MYKEILYSARPKFASDIIDEAAIENIKKILIGNKSIKNIDNPDDFVPDEFKTVLLSERVTSIPGRFIYQIPDARIYAGFVSLKSNKILPESDWRIREFKNTENSRRRFYRHKVYLKGDYYCADNFFSQNYGHWLSDDLPRLVEALPYLPSDTKIILFEPFCQFKIDSLSVFGITQERLIYLPGYVRVYCETLWYATPLNDMIWNHEVINKIRNKLISKYKIKQSVGPEKLYVSRLKSTQKRLQNESQLLPVLEKHNFTMVYPEILSLQEQVDLFSNARFIIGPFGAGLTNILFSPTAHLMELQDCKYVPRVWFWKWASILGHQYSTIIGDVENDEKGFPDTRFSINPSFFDDFVTDRTSAISSAKNGWWREGINSK